ncbi:methyltransferase [Croceitalea sp. MTPC9]|uniref:tRNA1(Val) (adenine(37)-N6)-methyltransferase n=1 Tax=unclassified Croceitalea TaxID=2632280 RepID=UPI002B38E147|nr:methyltransferase [Croceitalea sp. MTPC6]GMN17666.1 methyltransferase [Croceitalea sp. MTPC9]
MSKPFEFKEFTVNQDRCAMKIGTDGVLLGAWTALENNPNSILDIGTGTGIIALQMAQRSNAETIDAIELEEGAYEQCVQNFEESQWADRLFCYHASLKEFAEEMDETYDLIVSNPPFYMEDVSSGDKSRDKARQNLSLPFGELIEGIKKLLSSEGEFAVIIPFKEEENFLKQAMAFGLYANRITYVKGNPDSEIKRSLLQFSFKETTIQKEELVIEIDRHQYTKAYKELTAPFYLKM